jgi:hypothetical protein
VTHATVSLLAIALLAGAGASAAAQDAGGARISDLLMLVDAADPQAARDAAATLTAMGPSIGPALADALKDRKSCQGQWLVSGVLHDLGVEAAIVETARILVAQGQCRGLGPRDVQVQQEAAFAIVDRPAGVRALTAMLRGDDPAGRLKAASAFDRLTARLDPGAADPLSPAPGLLDAAAAALPALQKVALHDDDPATRCAAHAALDRAGRSTHDALRQPAARLLGGKTFRCGTTSGATAGAAPATTPRETIERAVRRLDQEKAETAPAAVSTLVGFGAEAVPILVARAGQTQKCRALALIGNALLRLDAAPATVDAALRRVVRGDCDGRDDFDRSLAQHAANTFITRAEGLAMLTALLAEADPFVRRRVARAFGTLYDRLGPGNAGVAVDDPDIIDAATRSLAPLVKVATADRDDEARCNAVRALRLAQTSIHDQVRTEAETVTAGRSLLCGSR